MARKANPDKYPCFKCGSSNLRFRADGHTYQCYACGHNGDKEKEKENKG
jgi:predicted RNA-binding Zn-ribbon protein involved in translation (DUF1610 family)